jgi:hypothetical protein
MHFDDERSDGVGWQRPGRSDLARDLAGLAGDWADEPIHIVGIQPWNGFEEFVRQRVMDANGKRGAWRGESSPDEDVSSTRPSSTSRVTSRATSTRSASRGWRT